MRSNKVFVWAASCPNADSVVISKHQFNSPWLLVDPFLCRPPLEHVISFTRSLCIVECAVNQLAEAPPPPSNLGLCIVECTVNLSNQFPSCCWTGFSVAALNLNGSLKPILFLDDPVVNNIVWRILY